MKIRLKIAIITSVIGMFMILFGAIFLDNIIITGFVNVEDSHMINTMERVNDILSEKILSIDFITNDYAVWDSSYYAITGENMQYSTADLVGSLENTNLDFVVLIRNDGKIMLAKDMFSGEEKSYNATTANLDTNTFYYYFEKNYASLICLNESDKFSGFIQLPPGLAMISSKPILKSDGTGPVQGTIIFGKMIDKPFIEKLSNQTHLSIYFYPYESISYENKLKLSVLFNNTTPIDNVKTINASITNEADGSKTPIQILHIDERTISGNALLKDIFGKPVALLKVNDERDIYLGGKTAVKYLVQVILVSVILLVIVGYWLFNKFIISRLVSMEQQMKDIQIKKLASSRIIITGEDELSSFCQAVNDALDVIEKISGEKNYAKELKKELDKKTLDLRKNVTELEESKKASLNIMDDLAETNKHLKDLDKAKTDFLNVASHELKTPLTAISAYLEILDDYKGQFNAEQLQGLDAIKRNSNQLKMLIGNILEISRLDSGRFDLNVSEVNVKEKIIALVDNLKILSDNKHIELKYNCDSVGIIHTDAMRFEEILTNLVGNAIKFTDKGSVTVKTEYGAGKEKGFIVVSVIDTGVGIPKDKMKNLFQKFYQVDATVSRKYGGTGLGLSISKKMIELQGGKISVKSIEGKGTTFRFTLPIKSLKKLVVNANSKVDTLYTNVEALTVDKTVNKIMQNKSKDNIKKHLNSKQINRHTTKKKK